MSKFESKPDYKNFDTEFDFSKYERKNLREIDWDIETYQEIWRDVLTASIKTFNEEESEKFFRGRMNEFNFQTVCDLADVDKMFVLKLLKQVKENPERIKNFGRMSISKAENDDDEYETEEKDD